MENTHFKVLIFHCSYEFLLYRYNYVISIFHDFHLFLFLTFKKTDDFERINFQSHRFSMLIKQFFFQDLPVVNSTSLTPHFVVVLMVKK